MKTKVFIALCLAALCIGCRQDVDLVPIDGKDDHYIEYPDGTRTISPTYVTASDSYSALFKAFWQGMNENYVFWDVEPTGYWDDVWDTYKPKFDALGSWEAVTGRPNADIARDYIAEMVAPLKDGHLFVQFDESVSSAKRDIIPMEDKVDARYPLVSGGLPDDSPQKAFYFNNWSGDPTGGDYGAESNWNYIEGLIEPKYAITSIGWAGAGGFHIALGKIGTGPVPTDPTSDYIIYLSFNEFSITGNLGVTDAQDHKVVAIVLEQYLGAVVDARCKGVIYDLRGNTGGANIDIPLLLSPLLTKDLHFAYTRTKKGVNRLDYMPWMPYIFRANSADPADGIRAANAGTMQVVALINDYSISCGELMPLAIKSMHNGYLIGTRTWGATGPRWGDTSPAATHDGSFSGNKLWLNVTESGWQTKGRNFESYEGVGITPDEEVEFDWNEFRHGNKDVQLEAAIAHIKASLP